MPTDWAFVHSPTPLRKAPAMDAEVIAQIAAGDTLRWTGQISKGATRWPVDGIDYADPWIEITSPDRQNGWINAAFLNLDPGHPNPLFETIATHRLGYFVRPAVRDSLLHYHTCYHSARTSRDFKELWNTGERLLPLLHRDLTARLLPRSDESVYPDFSWLEYFLPGYYSAVDNNQCRWYRDFKALQRKAIATSGKEDDALVQVGFSVYCLDSLEYAYPCWTIEEASGRQHSRLGEGIHWSVAKALDDAFPSSDLFQNEWFRFKNLWMKDIMSQETTYWNNQVDIATELKKIRSSPFRMLNDSDRGALETRIRMFEHPVDNGLIVNLRSGNPISPL